MTLNYVSTPVACLRVPGRSLVVDFYEGEVETVANRVITDDEEDDRDNVAAL